MPISEPSVTMFPPPCLIMCGTACLTSVNMPLTLVVRTASHSSSVSCSIGMTLVMPALQTSTSIAPNVPTVSATIRPASAIDRTSPSMPVTVP